MSHGNVRPLSAEALRALTTRRLLAYQRRLMRLWNSVEESGLDATELANLDRSVLWFKDEPAWVELCASVKTELATREHVERGVRR